MYHCSKNTENLLASTTINYKGDSIWDGIAASVTYRSVADYSTSQVDETLQIPPIYGGQFLHAHPDADMWWVFAIFNVPGMKSAENSM